MNSGSKLEQKSSIKQNMEHLEFQGTVITADALNTQKSIVEKAIEKGADYVLPIKGNHPNPLEETLSAFKKLDEDERIAKDGMKM